MGKPFQFSIRQALWLTVSLCVTVGLFAAMSARIEETRATLPKAPIALGCLAVGALVGAFACTTPKAKAIVVAFAITALALAVYMILP